MKASLEATSNASPNATGRPRDEPDEPSPDKPGEATAPGEEVEEELEKTLDNGGPASLRRAVVRFALLVILVGAGLVAVRWTPLAELWQPERLTALFAELRQAWWAPVALLGLYLVLCPLGLPASPLILAGGFVFGAAFGGLLNFLGTFLGAAVSFFLGHHLGRDLVIHLGGERLRRVEALLHRQSFWNLARIRFVPVPFPIVNYGAALAGVRASSFLGGTALGLAPAVFIYTWFAAALIRATGEQRSAVLLQLGLAVAAVLLLSFLPPLIRGWNRRRRYRRLREERGRRQAGTD